MTAYGSANEVHELQLTYTADAVKPTPLDDYYSAHTGSQCIVPAITIDGVPEALKTYTTYTTESKSA